MDVPFSLPPLSSSAAPERIFGGNEFGVLVLLKICCPVSQYDPLDMPGHFGTYVRKRVYRLRIFPLLRH